MLHTKIYLLSVGLVGSNKTSAGCLQMEAESEVKLRREDSSLLAAI